MHRREAIAALTVLGTCALSPTWAQDWKLRRIGFLAVRSRSTPAHPDSYYDAFVAGMHDLGYVEGRNLAIEWRFADGDYKRLPGLAADLVQANVEVIVTHSTPGTREAQRATRSIPIVTAASLDLVNTGLIKDLAHPGGNVTGLSQILVDVSPKQLELLKLLVPKLTRLGILTNPSNRGQEVLVKTITAAAQQAGVTVVIGKAENADEIDSAFSSLKTSGAEAAIVAADTIFISLRKLIADSALRNRMPVITSYREDVEAGCLISYGQNVAAFYRRAASYVDRILNGAKPGDLPVEQPTTIHLAVNASTARALRIQIPQELRLRADEVIE